MEPKIKYFEQKTADGQDHKVSYAEWGSGKKLCVCVHGLTRNGRDFDWLGRALADDFTVICPDMPGRGNSEWLKNPENYSNEYNVEIALNLIKSYGATEVDWVGTSMGGIMGMIIAAIQPKLFRKMVLNDIGALISEEGMRRIKTYVKDEVKFDTRESAEARFREIFSPFRIEKEEDWGHYFVHGLRETSDGKFSFNHDPAMGAAFPEPQEVDMWRLWQANNIPTLILRGAESDILPQDVAQKMAEKENAKLVEFEGFGHVPPLIDQNQIDVVKDFLCS